MEDFLSTNPVTWFEMPFEDGARVAEFYTKAFGWKMNDLGEQMDHYTVANTAKTDESNRVIVPNAINGGFFRKKADMPAQQPMVTITVNDVTKAVKDVTTAGGTVLGEPMEIPGIGKYVVFKDSEGNHVAILQPNPRT